MVSFLLTSQTLWLLERSVPSTQLSESPWIEYTLARAFSEDGSRARRTLNHLVFSGTLRGRDGEEEASGQAPV